MRIVILGLIIISSFFSCKDHDYVTIETDMGKMEVILLNTAPQHKANFRKLVNEGYYNDLLFHRVISGFMIQGGDPESRGAATSAPLGTGGPGYTIPAINPQKESSGSQFFIVHGQPVTDAELDASERSKGFKYTPAQREKYKKVGGTPMLDGDYTVFGEVVKGMDVIDKIAATERDNRDRPLKDIKMKIY